MKAKVFLALFTLCLTSVSFAQQGHGYRWHKLGWSSETICESNVRTGRIERVGLQECYDHLEYVLLLRGSAPNLKCWTAATWEDGSLTLVEQTNLDRCSLKGQIKVNEGLRAW